LTSKRTFRHRFPLPATAILFALACLWLAPSASAAVFEPGVITGKVVQESDGEAVVEAEVCARPTGNFLYGETCVLSGAGGIYEITIPHGQFVVNQYVTFMGGAAHPYLAKSEYGGEVEAPPGGTTPDINGSLPEGGVIKGRAVDSETGAPVPYISACMGRNPPDESEFGVGAPGCHATDENGDYEFINVPVGVYGLFFRDMIGGYEKQGIPDVAVTAGATTVKNASILKTARMSGHVYLADGVTPVGLDHVCASAADDRGIRYCTRTGPNGEWELKYLLPGDYKVAFSVENLSDEGAWLEDSFPTQWWNLKSSESEAAVVSVAPNALVSGIDGRLGYVPPAPTPPSSTSTKASTPPPSAPVATAPKRKPRACAKGKVRRQVKGKTVCVKRHKQRPRHKSKAHRKHRSHRATR
jgi:hypothetical protein